MKLDSLERDKFYRVCLTGFLGLVLFVALVVLLAYEKIPGQAYLVAYAFCLYLAFPPISLFLCVLLQCCLGARPANGNVNFTISWPPPPLRDSIRTQVECRATAAARSFRLQCCADALKELAFACMASSQAAARIPWLAVCFIATFLLATFLEDTTGGAFTIVGLIASMVGLSATTPHPDWVLFLVSLRTFFDCFTSSWLLGWTFTLPTSVVGISLRAVAFLTLSPYIIILLNVLVVLLYIALVCFEPYSLARVFFKYRPHSAIPQAAIPAKDATGDRKSVV